MTLQTPRLRRTRVSARLIVLTLGAFVMIAPFLYMVSTSFKPNVLAFEWPPRFIPSPATIDNYVTAWTANNFARYFANSALVALATTVATTLLAAFAAYAFARFTFPGRALLFWTMMLGLMVPSVVIIIPQFLVARSLSASPTPCPAWCSSTSAPAWPSTRSSCAGSSSGCRGSSTRRWTWTGPGRCAGSSSLYLPLSRPALATSAIFAFLASWDEYVWALTTINDPEKQTLPLAIAQYQGQHSTAWGLVFAASLIGMVPVIAVFLLGQRHVVSGLQTGALKS